MNAFLKVKYERPPSNEHVKFSSTFMIAVRLSTSFLQPAAPSSVTSFLPAKNSYPFGTLITSTYAIHIVLCKKSRDDISAMYIRDT